MAGGEYSHFPIKSVLSNLTLISCSKANVMLEYTYDEALELLTNNFTQASETVVSLENDLDFIKDQITTTEVTMEPLDM